MGLFHSVGLSEEREKTLLETHANLHLFASSEYRGYLYDLLDGVENDKVGHLVNFNLLNDKGETALHCASRTDSKYVSWLLAYKKTNPHIRNHAGQTALHYAARAGHVESVKYLLKAGVNVNRLDNEGRSALYEAVKCCSMPVVQLLITKGANVKASSKNGQGMMSILSAALQSKNMKMLDFILRLDGAADVNAKSPDGTSPLHFAVHLGIPVSIARYMIRQGADVNKQDRAGVSVLHHALRWGTHEHVRLLVDNGADVGVRDRKGLSAFHYAVLSVDSTENVVKTIKCLMELGEKLSDTDTDDEGSTLLHRAAVANANSALLMNFILEHSGRHADERDASARTALHHAARLGNDENCESLLRRGCADVNAKCVDGRSPLFYAIQKCRTSTVELLLQHGAGLSEELLQKHLFKRQLKSDLTRLLVKHLAKIQQSREDSEIQENDWELIHRHDELKNLFWAAVSEFKMMGEIKLFENITLQDVASKSRTELTSYARNKELVKNFEEKYREKEYSIFAKDLARFKLIIVRQRLLARAALIFDEFQILNEEVNQRIIGFLGDDDLRYFLGDFRKFCTHASLEVFY